MIKKTKLVVALLFIGMAISCKQAQSENASDATLDKSVAENSDTTSVISSSAAAQPKNSNRKFVRTADIKFKVKNVAKSTTIVEDATNKFGGFVTYTNLQSNIADEDKTKVSPDSTLVTTKFTVENNLTIRVPNTQLDTVIKTIASQIGFLNYRVIKADDVTLQMLSNKMAQKRSSSTEKRIATAIDTKGKKLTQIIDAEENLGTKKEANDTKTIENLSLQDQVNFSTLTLLIYQDQTIKQEMIANEKSVNAYRPNIGLQLWDSIKTGWFILEEILSFLAVLWPFGLIGFLGFIGYKKFIKK
ncbi:DUF4349 domain-containing protein [Flavobacterium sp.]|uniref:DUF4349 domain-containing protein n=1 Tax=Flavobacterium sp. TaxID=239 RepID=UPI0037523638